MADEILTGSGGGNTTLVAKVASKEILLKLGDRNSLRYHPALVQLGTDLIGATVLHGQIFGLDGTDLMTSRTEIQTVSNTALDVADFNCTPARYGIAYSMSDYMRALDQTGVIDPVRFAASIVQSAMMTFTNLIAVEGSGFTQVGSTGVKFTHDTFLASQFAMEQALVPGPYLFVMKPKIFNDWQGDLETRGGVTQWRPQTAEMQVLRGVGSKGLYNEIEVLTSNQVQGLNTNADWGSFIFGRGAIGFKEVAVPVTRSMIVLANAGPVLVEEVRSGLTTETKPVGQYNVGTVKIESARGRVALGKQ